MIRIEKASAAVHGLHRVINRQFLEQARWEVVCVDREQDVRAEGPRRAKHSYHPRYMVERLVAGLR